MGGVKGRPIIFLGLCLTSWVGSRVISGWTVDHMPPTLVKHASDTRLRVALQPTLRMIQLSDAVLARPVRLRYQPTTGKNPLGHWASALSPVAMKPAGVDSKASEHQPFRQPGVFDLQQVTEPFLPHPVLLYSANDPVDKPVTGTRSLIPAAFNENRASVYAYSFWRTGGGGTGLSSAGQYGGSQSGVIVSYQLRRHGPLPLAVYGRASAAPRDRSSQELALGLRTRPVQRIPIALSIESRFRRGSSPQAAAYLAGGFDPVALPGTLRLSGYGQAGAVLPLHSTASPVQPFYDGNLRLDRVLVKRGAVVVAPGLGIWTGGQRGISRVDFGPTLQSDVKVGTTSFRVTADWRFRIAGNARPGNGPALTISTSF